MYLKNWTTEKILTRLLTNKNQKNYWNYIYELRSRKTNKIYIRAYALTKSVIAKEKIIGIYILAQLGFNPRFQQEKTVNRYFSMLQKEQSPKVLAALFSSISHNNENLNQSQIEKLVSYKNHSYSTVRFELTLALSCIENEIAINTLISFMKDKHHDVRNWATFGIGTQIDTDTKAIRNALWNNVEDSHEDTRIEAILGLSKRNCNQVKELLKTKLQLLDEDRYMVLQGVEAFHDKDFIPLLKEKINENIVDTDWTEYAEDILENLTK